MRILFIGDIVGEPGRRVVERTVPGLIEQESLDLVVANAENAAGGSGLTPELYKAIDQAGCRRDHAGRSPLPPQADLQDAGREREHRAPGEPAAGGDRPAVDRGAIQGGRPGRPMLCCWASSS